MCRYNWHSAGSLGWLFPMLKYKIVFSNKIYGSNFSKQHSETVIRFDYWQNADCSSKNKFIVSFLIILGTLSFPVVPVASHTRLGEDWPAVNYKSQRRVHFR